MNTEKLKIEVWSDVVCPFCYIGKRNYDLALADFEHADEVELEFKSFQLDPDFEQDPNNKYDLAEGLALKYEKTLDEIHQMQDNIVKMAESVGLKYDFDKAVRFNTFNAHRTAHAAKEKGLGNKLEEALFVAYFTEGKDLGNPEVLKETALSIGLKEEDIEKALTDDRYAYAVGQDVAEAAQLGISGVPFFVFDRKYGVSGAQPSQTFLETLKTAHKEWKEARNSGIQILNEGESCDVDGNCD